MCGVFHLQFSLFANIPDSEKHRQVTIGSHRAKKKDGKIYLFYESYFAVVHSTYLPFNAMLCPKLPNPYP